MNRRTTLVMSAALTCMLSAGVAGAQGYGPPPPPPQGGAGQPGGYQPPGSAGVQRFGLTFGGDIGLGVMTADCGGDCGDALGSGQFGFHIGLMINPVMAIMYDAHIAAHPFDDDFVGSGVLAQQIHTAALQYWVAPQIWVKGGLGFGYLSVSYDDGFEDASETVPAILLAAGYEFLQAPNFAIDGIFKVGAGFYGDDTGQDTAVTNVTFNIGASWY